MADSLLLGLDSYSYHLAAPIWEPIPPAPMGLPDYLDRAAELGMDGLETADMGHFPSTDGAFMDELVGKAARLGLYLELGTGGLDREHLASTLELSRRVGSPVLRTFVSIGQTWGGSEPFARQRRRALEGLRKAIPLCERTGVALAIENHQDLTSVELAELLAEVDHPLIGACLDTGNALGVLEHPSEALENLADRTLTVHLKSYAVLPAEGEAGYVLVGVPAAENAEFLRHALHTLRVRSPAEVLHVNLESALECIPVTAPRRGWTDAHARAAERILAAYGPWDADRLAERGRRADRWRVGRDASIEEAMAMEVRLVRQSAADARALLTECV